MPNGVHWKTFWATLLGVALLLVAGLFVFHLQWVKPVRDQAQKIHVYLGTNRGPQSEWRGLVGTLHEDAIGLRKYLTDLNCRVRALEENKCPPGEPPSERPKNPPAYP
jgi:hypothetical protein